MQTLNEIEQRLADENKLQREILEEIRRLLNLESLNELTLLGAIKNLIKQNQDLKTEIIVLTKQNKCLKNLCPK